MRLLVHSFGSELQAKSAYQSISKPKRAWSRIFAATEGVAKICCAGHCAKGVSNLNGHFVPFLLVEKQGRCAWFNSCGYLQVIDDPQKPTILTRTFNHVSVVRR